MYDHYEHANWAGPAAPEQLSHLVSDLLRALGAVGDAPPGMTEPHKNETPGLQAEGFNENDLHAVATFVQKIAGGTA